MESVLKYGIWARSELAIGHDVRWAFRTGGIRTWGCNRAVKTNRLVYYIFQQFFLDFLRIKHAAYLKCLGIWVIGMLELL